LTDERGKVLHVKAAVAHLQLEWVQHSSDDSGGSKRPAPFPRSVQISGLGPIHLTQYTTLSLDVQQSLSSNTWTGLLLGHGKRSGTRYVLVVGKTKPGDDFLERVGIIGVPDQWLEEQELYKDQFWLG
jgi:hypothetical protein